MNKRNLSICNAGSLVNIVIIGMIMLLVIPFMWNIFHSLHAADDFTKYVFIHEVYDGTVFIQGIKSAAKYYQDWQGTFFYLLLGYCFEPLIHAGYQSKLLGIELNVVFMMFIVSEILFFKVTAEYIFHCTNKAVWLGFSWLFLFMCLNAADYPEVFFWWSGASMYLISSAFALFVMSMIIRLFCEQDKVKQKRWGNIISIAGFFICMEFNIPVFVLGLYLSFLLRDYLWEKKITWKVIPFLFCLAGTLICVLCPGNFKRQQQLDGAGIHILKAVINTCSDVIYVAGHLLDSPAVYAGLFLLLIASVCLAKKKKIHFESNPFVLAAGIFVLMFLGVFPNALAYGTFGMLPNRIIFVLNTFYLLSFSLWTVSFSCWLTVKFEKEINFNTAAIAVCAVAIMIQISFFSNSGAFENLPFVRNIISQSSVTQCYYANMEVFRQIESSSEEDVVITVKSSRIDSPDILHLPGYGTCADDWVNDAIARYFGKNSLTVIRE